MMMLLIGMLVIGAILAVGFRTERSWRSTRKKRIDPDELLQQKNRAQRESYLFLLFAGLVAMVILFGFPLGFWGILMLLGWGMWLYLQWLTIFDQVGRLVEGEAEKPKRKPKRLADEFYLPDSADGELIDLEEYKQDVEKR